ncbi:MULTISPECIES: hypothetical protein [Providencia]|uniref:Uncharacterized protein n=1 Tax=Providencia huaxiensis TaxID=2027290 RepID=A0A8I2AJ31_9GAMM|nr:MULTISPECIES: hypothetical protein [Providencia]MBQ0268172.1 hypothetical protein [Providencia huaxiensis]
MRTKNYAISPSSHPTLAHKTSQSGLASILNDIKNHKIKHPQHIENKSISPLFSSKYLGDFEIQAIRAYRQEERRIYREKCQKAFKFKAHNSLCGGMFSLAQQLANRSGENILAIIDNPANMSIARKKLFQPQTGLLTYISALGYALFG